MQTKNNRTKNSSIENTSQKSSHNPQRLFFFFDFVAQLAIAFANLSFRFDFILVNHHNAPVLSPRLTHLFKLFARNPSSPCLSIALL